MSTASVNNLSLSNLQQILTQTIQSSGPNSSLSNSILNAASGVATSQPSDSGRLSPFAQLLSTLQQLQQSNPTQYAQVTGQIATNLQNAAQADQAQGNATGAAQLSQLAADFTNASKTGQLPDVQDLARAIGGGHHHHHHAHAAASGDSDGDADGSGSTAGAASGASSGSASGGTNSVLSQFLSALQAGGAQNGSSNALQIIDATLSNAGITG